jgi:hypothetical protein
VRKPNPWIAVPAVGTGLLAGALGWMVTDVSCRSESTVGAGCPGWAALFAVASFLAVTIGVALLLVLVYRSLAEWRDRR